MQLLFLRRLITPPKAALGILSFVCLSERSRVRYLIPFSVLFVLSCIPYSDNPLTAPGQQPMDSSLCGTWFWKEEMASGYIHIGLDQDSKRLRLLMVEYKIDGELKVSEFSGHTSSLEGNRYLNLKWVRPAQDENTGYMFVKYAVGPASLGIALMDSTVAERAINKGLLKGRVDEKDHSSSVHISEGREKLQKFILRKDKELFPEMKYVQKLELPNKRSEQTP